MWKRDSIDGITVEADYVLVKLERGNDEVILNKGTSDEIKIFIPINEGNQEYHAPVMGTVVAAPKIITRIGAPEWKTECEVSKGDSVIMYYLSVVEALGGYKIGEDNAIIDDRMVIVPNGLENDVYIFIKYDSLYCKVVDDELHPLNGWCFGKKIERPVKMVGDIAIGLDANGERTENMKYYRKQVRVTHIGSKVEYTIGDYVEPDVEVDEVYLLDLPHRLAPLDVDIHSRLKERYYYFQRRHVVAHLGEPIEEKVHI